jgi:hypothetical protein
VDEWSQARSLIAAKRLPICRSHTQPEAAGLAGPCPANRFYVNGVLEDQVPVHVEASARVARMPSRDFVPFRSDYRRHGWGPSVRGTAGTTAVCTPGARDAHLSSGIGTRCQVASSPAIRFAVITPA